MDALHRYGMVFLVSLAILVAGISTAPIILDEPASVGAAHNFTAWTPSVNPERPPLAKYFIALSIKTFGDFAFGWRFPSAIAGALPCRAWLYDGCAWMWWRLCVQLQCSCTRSPGQGAFREGSALSILFVCRPLPAWARHFCSGGGFRRTARNGAPIIYRSARLCAE